MSGSIYNALAPDVNLKHAIQKSNSVDQNTQNQKNSEILLIAVKHSDTLLILKN